MIVISEHQDLITKVIICFKDVLLKGAGIVWPYFFATEFPMIESSETMQSVLTAPFPGIMGLEKNEFDKNLHLIK